MKTRKTTLAFILMAVLAITANAQQYDPESDFKFDWDPDVKDGVVITKYIGRKNEVRIPPSIQNYPVTSIGEMAFGENKNFTSVTIPNSVTTIGRGAFYGCTSLIAITVDSGNIKYSSEQGVLFNKNKTTLINCPRGKTGAYTIPNSVPALGRWLLGDAPALPV